jgi:hypothetical protein
LETEVAQPFQTVYDKKNRPIRARTLLDAAGQPIVDPKTGRPLIVDYDLDMDAAMAFGRSLRDLPVKEKLARMAQAFQQGAPLDMQRSYNKKVGGGLDEFVGAFTPAASFLLGVVGREADLSPGTIIKGGGLYNLCAKFDCKHLYEDIQNWKWNPKVDTSGPFFNNPENARWINEGIATHDSGRFLRPTKQDRGALQLPVDSDEKIDFAPFRDSTAPGEESPEQQGQPQDPADFGAADPRAPNRQFAGAGQPGRVAQAGPASALGLPQHVIDTGNYLRANGIEITPRTMYVANVLGPKGAVDLFKRTGSTSSDAVPSPDAATGQQMRAWARQLRLGPAAPAASPAAPDFGASVPPAPGPQAAWSNAAATFPGDVSEDAGLPV